MALHSSYIHLKICPPYKNQTVIEQICECYACSEWLATAYTIAATYCKKEMYNYASLS